MFFKSTKKISVGTLLHKPPWFMMTIRNLRINSLIELYEQKAHGQPPSPKQHKPKFDQITGVNYILSLQCS